ncbi:hypothetical protein GCM10010363_75450 [Streptomyces omiyaensis]|nr:hypothetical protein GCM10010363_75450 [Streptomyces omiyaensis]
MTTPPPCACTGLPFGSVNRVALVMVTDAAWAVPAAPRRERRTAQSAVSTVAVPEDVRRMIAYLVL